MLRDALHQLVQAVEAALKRLDHQRLGHAAALADRLQQRLHGVRQIADRRQTGHACTALEGVQIAL